MLSQLDYQRMEYEMINIEHAAAQYLQKIIQEENAQIMYLDTLNIVANIFGNGSHQITYW